jgi:hypothetical protein
VANLSDVAGFNKPQRFHGSNLLENQNTELNPTLTVFLTDAANTLRRNLTKKQKEFLTRAYRICAICGRPFWYPDFKHLFSNGAFRQHITNLRPIIENHTNTNPAQYHLRGIYLNKTLTESYTDLKPNELIYQNLNVVLSAVTHEKPLIHDIRLETKTSDLYENLILKGHKPNEQNGIITLTLNGNSYFTTKVNVTKDSIFVIIGCTHDPIEYSHAGIITLVGHCGEVVRFLKELAGFEFAYEPYFNWRFKYFHLNKDSIEYDFPTNDYTINVIFGHTQIYKHEKPNGNCVIRSEEKLTPKTTILEEIQTPRFQKASELS